MAKYLSFLILLSTSCFAQFTTPQKAYLVNKNILNNPGFEQSTQYWTASGGSFSATTTASKVGTGNAAGSWDSNSAAQTLTSTAVAIPKGLYAHNGLTYCSFQCPSGTCTHTINAYDGTNILATKTIVSSSAYVITPVNFVFPSSGNISVRVSSVASNEPELEVDDCYIGEATNVSQISQAQWLGSVTSTSASSCSWSTTSATYANFSADTDCSAATASGNASAPATKIPAVRFSSGLGPGTYLFIARGIFQATGTTPQCSYQFNDGTNSFGFASVGTTASARSTQMTGIVTYTAPQGDTTIQIQAAAYAGSGTPTCIIENDTTTFERFDIDVYKFPSATEAFAPDKIANLWSGYHDNDCSFSRTNTSIGDPSADASCTFTETQNVNFGTVASYTSGGNNLPGIVFTPSRAGRYFVCAQFGIQSNQPSNSVNLITDLSDLTPTVVASHSDNNAVQTGTQRQTHCGIYNATSTASVTLRLRSASTSTGQILITSSTSSGHTVDWSIFQVDQSLPAPLLVNSVVSSLNGVARVEWATAITTCSSSPCTIDSQSSGITNITRSATGDYTINFARAFSATPVCGMTVYQGSAFPRIQAVGTSTYEIKTFTVASSPAVVDVGFTVLCVGPN